jgi:hypothetical protein
MKEFSISLTRVYINEATALFLGECDIADPRYKPMAVS